MVMADEHALWRRPTMGPLMDRNVWLELAKGGGNKLPADRRQSATIISGRQQKQPRAREQAEASQ